MKNKNPDLSHSSIFARRLKEARKASGIPQDQLGVLIGLDEHTASARISRYESGIHQPPIQTAQLMSEKLGVPLAYLYCDDDRLAKILLKLRVLNQEDLSCLETWLAQKAS